MAVLANYEIGALLHQLAAGLLELRRRIAVVFLAAVIENDHIVAAGSQRRHLVGRFERIKGIGAGGVFADDGKLMLGASENAHALVFYHKNFWDRRLCRCVAHAHIGDPLLLQRAAGRRQPCLALIQNMIVGERQQVGMRSRVAVDAGGRRHKIFAAFADGRRLVAQRRFHIKNAVIRAVEERVQLAAEQLLCVAAGKQRRIACCRDKICADQYHLSSLFICKLGCTRRRRTACRSAATKTISFENAFAPFLLPAIPYH